MAKIVRALSIEQKNDRCIDGMFVFQVCFLQCYTCFFTILVRALNRVSKCARENCINGNSKGAGYFHEKQIYKSVLCTTPPDQKDKIRCQTFPVI